MSGILNETLLAFREAAKRLPPRRQGRPTHVSSLDRWARKGCHNVRLEYIDVGGVRCTSWEALERFFERVTAARCEAAGRMPPASDAARLPSDQSTEQYLRDKGFVTPAGLAAKRDLTGKERK